jgi:hypothetical protein
LWSNEQERQLRELIKEGVGIAEISGVIGKTRVSEQLHVLNAAIVALRKPGISRIEVARYSKIIDGVKVYNDLFAKFVDYRGLEIKVLELEKRLARAKNPCWAFIFRIASPVKQDLKKLI